MGHLRRTELEAVTLSGRIACQGEEGCPPHAAPDKGYFPIYDAELI